MKKLAIVLVVVCLLVFGAVIAEPAFEIDLTSLSVDELVSLRKAINDELFDRGQGVSSDLYPGKYDIGVQIPEGKYLVKATSLQKGSTRAEVHYYAEDKSWIDTAYLKVGEVYYFEFESPNYIRVEDGAVILMDYGITWNK